MSQTPTKHKKNNVTRQSSPSPLTATGSPRPQPEGSTQPHIDAVKYAREQVVPLYRLDEEGTPYERGMIRQIAAHWLAGYFAARPPTLDEGATVDARPTDLKSDKADGSATDPSSLLRL